MANEVSDALEAALAEIADLKQQLHAYREYHDARDAKYIAMGYEANYQANARITRAIDELNKIRRK